VKVNLGERFSKKGKKKTSWDYGSTSSTWFW